jgi:hypothetical protein
LDHAGRDAGGLEQVHQRARRVLGGEAGELAVDQIALGASAAQRVECVRARPRRVA